MMPFVGRRRECALLAGALAEARSGLGSVWLLSGPAGAGKTRLVEEVARIAAREGVRAVWGRCAEAGGAPSFWPWVLVLRALDRGLDPAARSRMRWRRGAYLARIALDLGDDADAPPPSMDPEQARFQLFDAVSASLADAGPLVIVLEDLHAADAESLSLFAFVARQIRGSSGLLVATYREREARGSPAFERLLAAAREGHHLALGPLLEDDVAQYLADALGSAPDPALARDVAKRTEGNALYLVEVARLLRDGADSPSIVPPTVAEALRARWNRLGQRARAVLDVAAVAGREIDSSLLLGVTEAPAAELAAAIAEGLALEIVDATPTGLRFSHELVRVVGYEAVAPRKRETLHARIAAAIAGEDDRAALAAHHAFLGGVEARALAIASASRAAECATARLAFEDAIAHRRTIVGALDPKAPAAERADALLELARAELLAHHVEAGRASCHAAAKIARAAGDTTRLARAALELGTVFVFASIDPRLVEILEEAERVLDPAPSPLRARVLARLAAALQPASDPEHPFALARAGIAMARRTGDPLTLLATLRDGVSALMDLAHPQERLPLNEETVALADRLGDPVVALRGCMRLAFDAYEAGDVARARAAVQESARRAEELPRPSFRWRATALLGMVAAHAGRFAEAERYAAEAAALASESREPGAPRSLVLQRLGHLRYQGRDDELRELLPSVTAAFATGETSEGMARVIVAGELARMARRDEARAALRSGDVAAMIAWKDTSIGGSLAEIAIATVDVDLMRDLRAILAARSGGLASGGMTALVWEEPIDATSGSSPPRARSWHAAAGARTPRGSRCPSPRWSSPATHGSAPLSSPAKPSRRRSIWTCPGSSRGRGPSPRGWVRCAALLRACAHPRPRALFCSNARATSGK
jgi:hypothetical protein